MNGVGSVCFVCRRTITEEDVDNSNKPMKMMSIPGWVHRKCKIDSESLIMGTSHNYQDLTGEIEKL